MDARAWPQAPTEPLSVHPAHGDIRLLLEDEHVDRLWRAHDAARLLSLVDEDAYIGGPACTNGVAAVADYIAQDLAALLAGTRERGLRE
jgi:hypothetical protein